MKKISIIIPVLVVAIVGGLLYWQNRSIDVGSTKIQTSADTKKTGTNKSTGSKSEIEASSLAFDKEQQEIGTNSDFSLNALMNPGGKKVNATELHIVFNPSLLKLESITPSDVFSLVLSPSRIDNEKGTASIVLAVPLGQPAVEKTEQIARFDFQSSSVTGQAEVSFTDKSIAAASGVDGDIISSRVSTIVDIK